MDGYRAKGYDSKFENKVRGICSFLRTIPGLKRNRVLGIFESLAFKDAVRCTLDDIYRIVTLRRFRKKLKRAYDYFIFGYNCEDYDYGYFLSELIWKLRRMKDMFLSGPVYSEHSKIIKVIDEIIVLLYRVYENNYDEKYEKKIVKKYGELVQFTSTEPVGNLRQLLIKREKENHTNFKQIKKLELEKWTKSEQDRINELKKALNLLADNIFDMWD